MTNIINKHVKHSLKLLADVAADQAAKYDELSDSISDTDSDDDYKSPTPIYDSFYNQGRSEIILQLTNFSSREFAGLWATIIYLVQPQWLEGRGRKSNYSAKDTFFIAIVTVTNGGIWLFLVRLL